jgi:hypothetical protein
MVLPIIQAFSKNECPALSPWLALEQCWDAPTMSRAGREQMVLATSSYSVTKIDNTSDYLYGGLGGTIGLGLQLRTGYYIVRVITSSGG